MRADCQGNGNKADDEVNAGSPAKWTTVDCQVNRDIELEANVSPRAKPTTVEFQEIANQKGSEAEALPK